MTETVRNSFFDNIFYTWPDYALSPAVPHTFHKTFDYCTRGKTPGRIRNASGVSVFHQGEGAVSLPCPALRPYTSGKEDDCQRPRIGPDRWRNPIARNVISWPLFFYGFFKCLFTVSIDHGFFQALNKKIDELVGEFTASEMLRTPTTIEDRSHNCRDVCLAVIPSLECFPLLLQRLSSFPQNSPINGTQELIV